MNLDELVDSIPERALRNELSRWVEDWKSDDSDVEALSALIRKWHGNVTFRDPGAQDAFHARFENFRENVIEKLGGMTVNERLYWLGLFAHWDGADERSRERLRVKLHAPA